jgi:hypothetical protein
MIPSNCCIDQDVCPGQYFIDNGVFVGILVVKQLAIITIVAITIDSINIH